MPGIPKQFLNCVFYLYASYEDAKAGKRAGGTGFLIAMPADNNLGLGHHYGVTNWHVAVRDGFSVIRFNTEDGYEIIERDPSEWIFSPGKYDIAVTPLSLRDPEQQTFFVSTQLMYNIEADNRFGPGDDVFMIGRFVDLEESKSNMPAVRFGNISTDPVPIEQPTGYKEGLSYCVDMHSRDGFSGSPVFVYRTPGSDFSWTVTGERGLESTNSYFALLGIHWGQFPEYWPVVPGKATEEEAAHIELAPNSHAVKGVSGMTCVIPAVEIVNVLDCELLDEQRRQENELQKQNAKSRPAKPDAETSNKDAAKIRDEMLRTMLSTPATPRTKAAPRRVTGK